MMTKGNGKNKNTHWAKNLSPELAREATVVCGGAMARPNYIGTGLPTCVNHGEPIVDQGRYYCVEGAMEIIDICKRAFEAQANQGVFDQPGMELVTETIRPTLGPIQDKDGNLWFPSDPLDNSKDWLCRNEEEAKSISYEALLKSKGPIFLIQKYPQGSNIPCTIGSYSMGKK